MPLSSARKGTVRSSHAGVTLSEQRCRWVALGRLASLEQHPWSSDQAMNNRWGLEEIRAKEVDVKKDQLNVGLLNQP